MEPAMISSSTYYQVLSGNPVTCQVIEVIEYGEPEKAALYHCEDRARIGILRVLNCR